MVCRWARCRVRFLGRVDVVLKYLRENRWVGILIAGLSSDYWAVAIVPCSRRRVLHWGYDYNSVPRSMFSKDIVFVGNVVWCRSC